MAFRVSGFVSAADLGFVLEELHKNGKLKALRYAYVDEAAMAKAEGTMATKNGPEDTRPLRDRVVEMVRRKSPRPTTRAQILEVIGHDEGSHLSRELTDLVTDGTFERPKKGSYVIGTGTPPAKANGAETPIEATPEA